MPEYGKIGYFWPELKLIPGLIRILD